jgi:hypothetical protein
VPAFAVNRTKRLIKTPKLYWADSGVALRLAELNEPSGAHLENVVLGDLLAWRDARTPRPEILYWRASTGEEVDFVIETKGSVVPIEVKATSHPTVSDARHLRTFRDEYGRLSRNGLLLHTGTRVEWLAPGILATPWWKLL